VFFRNFGEKDPNPLGNDNNPNELIHIKKYAPGSGYYGVPDIVAAQQAVAGNEFVARFNLDYFENKAVPRHVVILKGATINPKLAKNILEFFETGLKGQHHRALFVPLPADTKDKKVSLEFEAVETGVQEASFEKYRKTNTGEILMAHGVPVTKVGMPEGVNLAVARDADKTFKEQRCRPEQAMLEKKLSKIWKEFTDMFYMKLNEMTLTDEETQSKIDERRIKTGTDTQNEQRARRGLPSVDGGDELVDLNAASKIAEQRNEMQAQGNRERDAQRSAGATDSAGEGRNPKGEGRTTE
jgi:capsid portal protein